VLPPRVVPRWSMTRPTAAASHLATGDTLGDPVAVDGAVTAGPRSRRRLPAPWIATGALLFLLAGVRVVVQLRWGEVTGLDTGNWFTFGHAWLGQPLPDGAASTYPPLVPVVVALLGRVLDPLIVMAITGAGATLVQGGCVATVLWRSGCGWWTVPLTTALAAGSATGEAVAWGGQPQVLALGVALLVLYLTAELLLAPRRRVAVELAAAGLVLGATSHLVVAETVLAGVAVLLLRLLAPMPRPSARGARRALGLWGLAATPSLLLLPLYARLARTVGGSFAERQGAQPFVDFVAAVGAVSRELPLLWRPTIIFALLVPLVLWRERARPLWLVTAALAVTLGAVALVSPEPRFAYLVPLLVVAALGLVVTCFPLTGLGPLHVGVAVAGVVACTASAVGGLALFPEQVRYYGTLVPAGTTEALAALRASTAADDVVAVPPVRGLPFGWWVEGYGRRAAFVGSSSQWLNFPKERQRAEVSVALFSSADVFSDRWFRQARALGVDVVYLPTSYDGLAAGALERLHRDHPRLIVRSDSAATIVEVP
jgi:hypothetical protein